MAKSDTDQAGMDIVLEQKSLFDDEQLQGIKSFSDAESLILESGGLIEDFNDYGSGFSVLSTADKVKLVGVPIAIVEWRFNDGDNGEFVSAVVLVAGPDGTPGKWILNDGSTGIRDQLQAVTAKRLRAGVKPAFAQAGLKVSKGLRVSEYTYTDDEGKDRPAKTFYLAN